MIPTVIVLACYFCAADIALIGQCCYYNYINSRRARRQPYFVTTEPDEEAPLIAGSRRTDDSLGLPGSHRRASSTVESNQGDTLIQMLQEDESMDCGAWMRNTISVLLVIAAGTAGWAIAWRSGAWKPTPEGRKAPPVEAPPVGAEVMGYISAICYLGYV